MSKSRLLIIFSMVLMAVFTMNLISAGVGTIWNYNNFANYYNVYNIATCSIQGVRGCPNELGWQGSDIGFKFYLDKTLSGNSKFNLNVGYFSSSKPIDIYVSGHRIASDYLVNSAGLYSFEFPSSYLRPNRFNTIRIIMKDVSVGYGYPSQGFVISSVSLTN
ncbi:MAG: hypothetical protein AABX17_00290 [Nanoarchaeota archaeon]